MPEVSVVIAVRNGGRTIDGALSSVFAQTVRDHEVIVVDDGSTDDTVTRISAFGSGVIVRQHPSGGHARALTAGLRLARGRIVMLLDPADMWLPRKIERQLKYFERYPEAGFLHGSVIASASPGLTLLDCPDETSLSAGLVPPSPPQHLARPPAGLRPSTVALRRDVLPDVPDQLDSTDPVGDLYRRCATRVGIGRLDVPTAIVRSGAGGTRPGHGRVSLLQDTCFRRTRVRVAESFHDLDDALTSRRRGNTRRVLFEAASPMSLSVFAPAFHRLVQDPRLEFWFTSCDRSWDPTAIFLADGISERVIRPERARWAKFDAYINTDFWNMTWLRRRTRRVHFFHGVAGKYGLDAPVRIAPIVATFDRLMFPNRDRLRRYAEAGLLDADSPRAALIGYPKVDCLVDGSLDRNDVVSRLNLDASRPTVLYAPTWSPYSSLNLMGNEVIAALGRLGLNVVVKLHDRSYDTTTRGSGGIDWKQRLHDICQRSAAHLVQDADASPYLHAADLIVTDHSSVGFEFMLLDRPIVVLDSPDLVRHARVNPEKVAMLHSAAFVVEENGDVGRTVLNALAAPEAHRVQRRRVADELFYCPGSATLRAVECIYDLLDLPLPATSAVEPEGSLDAFAPLARSL
jgi:glycosyltransferase involved in cell wall biosynthesis